MFFAVMIIIPINLIKIVSSNSFLIEEKKVRIISNILISATGSFILVLLFNTKGLTMNVASILSVLNCVFLVILLIKNNPKYKDVLFEHWLITSIFIGLIYFIK